jgi:hypothetical protein
LPDFNYVEAPIASPIEGVIGYGVPVTLSQADGAEIFYTTDGSTPTTGSSKYTNPIYIYDHTIIKAIAVKNGISSIVVIYEYTVDNFPPLASNVVLSPKPKSGYSIGDTLTVTYAYTSPAGREQGSSKINWYRLSERDSARTSTNNIKSGINDGGDGLTYKVVGADSGYYICVEIIPIDSEGVQGEPVWEVSTKTVK